MSHKACEWRFMAMQFFWNAEGFHFRFEIDHLRFFKISHFYYFLTSKKSSFTCFFVHLRLLRRCNSIATQLWMILDWLQFERRSCFLKLLKLHMNVWLHVNSKSRKILINFVARPKVPSNILPIKLKTKATKFFEKLSNYTVLINFVLKVFSKYYHS